MTSFKLSEYINLLKSNGLVKDVCNYNEDTAVIKLTSDTRELDSTPALFVCKGAHFKDEYLLMAEKSGAVAAIGERYIECGIPFIVVNDVRASMSICAKLHADGADEKLYKIGITGTKGKSTVAYFVRSILNFAMRAEGKHDCAILSSIDNYDGVISEESHLTTPEPIDLFRHFENAAASGITHLVMEASSQGLKYGRMKGVRYKIGAFLNIGIDHISAIEHPDFDDYFNSKLKIFDLTNVGVVNRDIPEFDKVKEYVNGRIPLYSFGRKEGADFRITDLKKNRGSYDLEVAFGNRKSAYRITMSGDFNVSNALAAIAICTLAGIDDKYIRAGLVASRASGRMESYMSADGKVEVIVDYAHNKLSFEALFSSLYEENKGKRITAVFGCPGCKAQIRRRDLPAAAGRYCESIYVTEEDSGEESFESISGDIVANIPASVASYVNEDRGEAIRSAILEDVGKEAVVAITGKGRETRQKRGLAYIDCPSDVEFTKKYLCEYNDRIDTDELIAKFGAFKGKKVDIGIFGSKAIAAKNLDAEAKAICLYIKSGAKVKVYSSSPDKVAAALYMLGCECEIIKASETEALSLMVGDSPYKVVILHCTGALALGENRSETQVSTLSKKDLSDYVRDGVFQGKDMKIAKGAKRIIEGGCRKVSFLLPSEKAMIFDAFLPYPDGTVIQ